MCENMLIRSENLCSLTMVPITIVDLINDSSNTNACFFRVKIWILLTPYKRATLLRLFITALSAVSESWIRPFANNILNMSVNDKVKVLWKTNCHWRDHPHWPKRRDQIRTGRFGRNFCYAVKSRRPCESQIRLTLVRRWGGRELGTKDKER